MNIDEFIEIYNFLYEDVYYRFINVDSLNFEEFNQLAIDSSMLNELSKKIELKTKDGLKKLYTQDALHNPIIKEKIKNNKSVEFNTILLYQGKAAKSIKNVEDEAKKGDIDAQILIGMTYLHGVLGYYNETKMKDVGLGLKWLTVAYKNGSLEAGHKIACYEKMVFNIDNAIKLFRKLGENGYKDSYNELIKIYKYDERYKNMTKVLEIKGLIKDM